MVGRLEFELRDAHAFNICWHARPGAWEADDISDDDEVFVMFFATTFVCHMKRFKQC